MKKKLKKGLKEINILKSKIKGLDVRPDSEGFEDLMLAFDLEGSILSAESTIISAIARKESRGAHQRTDFTKTSKSFSKNFHINMDNEKNLKITTSRLKKISEELLKTITETKKIDNFSGMLLE